MSPAEAFPHATALWLLIIFAVDFGIRAWRRGSKTIAVCVLFQVPLLTLIWVLNIIIAVRALL